MRPYRRGTALLAGFFLLATGTFAYGQSRFSETLKKGGPYEELRTKVIPPFRDLVLIPSGRFVMGTGAEELEKDVAECKQGYPECDRRIFEAETPEHFVWLDAYFIDRYNVTNKQYLECILDNECTRPRRSQFLSNPEYADFPVVFVDWNQAQNYCSWAGGRLPTEAEWEKAARGLDGLRYPWGDKFDETRPVWNAAMPKAVGGRDKGQSTYRVQDMSGNVWDWVQDWFSPTYYEVSPTVNPPGPATGRHRVFRGGSWSTDVPQFLRSMTRNHNRPGRWSPFVGFRCVKDVEG